MFYKILQATAAAAALGYYQERHFSVYSDVSILLLLNKFQIYIFSVKRGDAR